MIRLLLVGGGTLGPLAPLLAVAESLRERDEVKILGVVGSHSVAEREMVAAATLSFFPLSAGKFRRAWDVRNLAAPFLTLVGCFEAGRLLRRLNPTVILSGGSFVGVPVVLAAWIKKIPVIIHQQDVRPSLANRLAAPFAKKITTVFSDVATMFSKDKVVVVGNPIRASIMNGDLLRARTEFNLEPGFPTVLIFGGGTGARGLNEIVTASLPELTKYGQIVHVFGLGKMKKELVPMLRYHPFELLVDSMSDAYAVSDLVVSRAGMGTITELAALRKAAILVPMPDSHQEENAKYLVGRNAAIMLSQQNITPEIFTEMICDLLKNKERREMLDNNISKLHTPNATARMIELIEELS